MKKIFLVSALVGLSLFSCKKEEKNPASPTTAKTPKTATANDKTVHCAPWQDETDLFDAVKDLNAIVPCNTATCSGSLQSTYENTGRQVRNYAGTATMYYAFFEPGSMANQNYIWNDAMAQAALYTPPGYSISCVHNFQVVLVTSPPKKLMITFDITYIKCADGGGGQN